MEHNDIDYENKSNKTLSSTLNNRSGINFTLMHCYGWNMIKSNHKIKNPVIQESSLYF